MAKVEKYFVIEQKNVLMLKIIVFLQFKLQATFVLALCASTSGQMGFDLTIIK
jgi:hypothetical protein